MTDSGHTPDETGGLALSFRSGEELVSHPVGEVHAGAFGSGDQRGVFVVGGSDAVDVASWVVERRSSGSGHALRLAATESLDKREIRGHNKSMTTTQNMTSRLPACEYNPHRPEWQSVTDDSDPSVAAEGCLNTAFYKVALVDVCFRHLPHAVARECQTTGSATVYARSA